MKKNIFGTDGIRARIGLHPFTIDALPELGKALGQWAIEKYGTSCRILIAHDTRQSSSWVMSSLQAGLLTYPVSIDNADILPTPGLVALLSYDKQYQCGIMISASHNPYHDNGIKIIDATQGKISENDELRITELFYAGNPVNYTTCGTMHALMNASERYINLMASLFTPRLLEHKKIVLDCANGATSIVAPAIFKKLGAQTIVINNIPNGTNINNNCGALHVDSLKQSILEHHADIGFAFDGDGDRLIAVNAQGHIKDGDDMLALLADHPRYAASPIIVGTVMTNQGFEQFLKNKNKTLVRTKVGDKYIAEQLEMYGLEIGGEPSGHIILRDYLNTGDGIYVALKLCETLQTTNNWTLTSFSKYPQVLKNITVNSKKDLSISPLSEIIASIQSKLGQGRILVRYSGTEPLLRIMAEAEDAQIAQDAVLSLCQQLADLL